MSSVNVHRATPQQMSYSIMLLALTLPFMNIEETLIPKFIIMFTKAPSLSPILNYINLLLDSLCLYDLPSYNPSNYILVCSMASFLLASQPKFLTCFSFLSFLPHALTHLILLNTITHNISLKYKL